MSAVEKATSGEYSEKYTKATTTNQTAANSAAVTTKTKTTTTILKPYQKYNQQQQEQQQRQEQHQQHQHHQHQRQYQQHSSPRHQQHNNHPEHQQYQQQQSPYQIHHQNHRQNHHQHHHQQHQYQYQYQQYPEKSVTTTATETTTTKKPTIKESGNDDARSCIALEETSTSTRLVRPCLSHVLTVLFSTPGLVLLVILYSMMGGLLFPLLEAPQDITKSLAIAKSREDCLRELWIITEKLNVLYERNWTMLVHEQLRRFEGSIVAATRYGGLGSVDGEHDDGSAVAERFGGQMDALLEARWTFSEALLYSVTVITTIGHGSLTPKTSAGKIATILYALIGVPLMLMCLSSLGALLADALQCTYARICCRLTRSRGRGSASKQHRISRCDSRESEDVGRGGRLDDVARVSETEDSTNDRESHASQQKYEMDCKSCKYDAVMSETNPNKGYPNKYPVNGARGKETDSCQLLHNSSMSVNHHSPCMQLKSATMAANGQYYHQQQQQQQHHQHQHPDVMHLNAVCGNSSVMPPSPKLSSATYCSRSATPIATPSPQLLHHPLQQNYQLASSAINSTPTHPDYVHMHSQHHQQLPHLYQQQQQQHFVAVPSNILRFQPAASPPNNAVLNFYQSSPIAIPGSATIYFPISAPSAAATTLASATGTATVLAAGTATVLATGTTTASGATTASATGTTTASLAKTTLAVAVSNGTQVLAYPQPLVKYHTIQLQPKKPPPPPSYVAADAPEILTTNQGHVTFSLGDSIDTETTTTAAAITSDTLPLPFPPPPPAYQTATVHGIRRAKFLTKPMPHGINTLLAETQISCRRDSSQNCNTSTSESAATATMPTTTSVPTTAMTSVHPTLRTSALTVSCLNSTAGGETTTTAASLHPTRKGSPAIATTTTLLTANMNGSNSAVDIMEDEEESEQHRMGSCPHGTPSRVPLISSATGRRNLLTTDSSKHKEGGAGKTAALLSRGLMNSTAASFHRHTLNTFQRGAGGGSNRRTAFIQSRRNCSVHRLKGGTSYNVTGGCYGDTTETSDDDDYLPHGSADFVLNGEEEDDDEDDSEDGVACDRQRDSDSVPQVPITIVLLILVCYICLGTVIFAFWENWSLIDGAYFCFVTLATIGYGDFRPERTFNGPEVQLFACCAYLLLGLVLVAMSFSILETQLMWKCKRIAVRLKLAKD